MTSGRISSITRLLIRPRRDVKTPWVTKINDRSLMGQRLVGTGFSVWGNDFQTSEVLDAFWLSEIREKSKTHALKLLFGLKHRNLNRKKVDSLQSWSVTMMSRAGVVFRILCEITLTLTSLRIFSTACYFKSRRVNFWLLLLTLGVSVRDAGGYRIAEDERLAVEHIVHSRLNFWYTRVFEFLLAHGLLLSQDCGSGTQEWKANMDTIWSSLQLNIHCIATLEYIANNPFPTSTCTWPNLAIKKKLSTLL